jgi:hypothetical protein
VAGVGHWACRPVSASTGCHWERRLETCLSFVFEELTGGDRDGVAGGDALFFRFSVSVCVAHVCSLVSLLVD